MTHPLRPLMLVVLSGLLCVPGSCQTPGALTQANQLYDAGRFSEAAAAYERARASGLDGADVLYNLGNSYARAHQLGRALAAYRAALRIAPRDRDLRHNLDQVSAQRADLPPTPVSFFSAWTDGLLDKVTRNELATTALLLWWACCVLGLAALRGWGRRRRVLAALGAAGTLWALTCAATVAAQVRGWGNPPAFIAAEGAQLHSGPGERFDTTGTLSDGAQVQVVGRSGMWLELAIGDGRHAWALRDQVATLDPPAQTAAK